MKVLLDEDLPHAYRHSLPEHETSTAFYNGWSGMKNGVLLGAAANAGFHALITADKNLSHQQNVGSLPLAVIVVCEQELHALQLHRKDVLAALERAAPGSVQYIDWLAPNPESGS